MMDSCKLRSSSFRLIASHAAIAWAGPGIVEAIDLPAAIKPSITYLLCDLAYVFLPDWLPGELWARSSRPLLGSPRPPRLSSLTPPPRCFHSICVETFSALALFRVFVRVERKAPCEKLLFGTLPAKAMTMNTKREIKANTAEEIVISFVAVLVLSAAAVIGGALLGTSGSKPSVLLLGKSKRRAMGPFGFSMGPRQRIPALMTITRETNSFNDHN